MQISSFEVLELVKELQELVDAYIDKVYQVGKDDILLKLRKKGTGKIFVFARAGRFLFKSERGFETPEKPSRFAMTLRKHIERGRITRIYQHEFDRIILFDIERRGERYHLVFEMIPNGNIVLLDSEHRIIIPFREQTWSHRTIKPGEIYIFPPSQKNPLKMNMEEFSNAVKSSNKDTVRTLAIDIGLGGIYAEEICLLSGVEKNKPSKELEDEEIERIYSTLLDIIRKIDERKISPEIVFKDDKIAAVTPFHLRSFDHFHTKSVKSLCEALEYAVRRAESKMESEAESTMRAIEHQIKQQMEGMLNLIKKSEEKRKEGDLIYIHLDKIDHIIGKIREILKEKDKEKFIEKIKSIDIVEDIHLDEGTVKLRLKNGEEKLVEIDFRKSAAENANEAYQLSKKYREKAERAKKAIEESKLKLEKGIEEEKREKIAEEKEFWFERYRWCISSRGNLIIGGRDARTNERVVKRHMEDDDIYVHADVHGAPSCILKCRDIDGNRVEITPEAIKEACQFAGVYSKAWKQFGEIPVYWVYPYQVSKTPQSGEFLPRGAFVIRGKRNYMSCRMEMAVGEVEIKGVKKIMGGAVESVSKMSKRYVVLQPGSVKKERISKTLAEKFGVSQEKVMKALPPGDVQVVRVYGINPEGLE